MSETTVEPEAVYESTYSDLGSVVIASIVAGVAFGSMIQFVMGTMQTIGALFTFGQEGLLLGWVTHMGLSFVFALVFVVVTWSRSLENYTRAPTTGIALGAAYGFVLWVVNVGFVWPIWMNVVGINSMLPVPFLFETPALQSFGGHLVWGGVLGLVYSLLR